MPSIGDDKHYLCSLACTSGLAIPFGYQTRILDIVANIDALTAENAELRKRVEAIGKRIRLEAGYLSAWSADLQGHVDGEKLAGIDNVPAAVSKELKSCSERLRTALTQRKEGSET